MHFFKYLCDCLFWSFIDKKQTNKHTYNSSCSLSSSFSNLLISTSWQLQRFSVQFELISIKSIPSSPSALLHFSSHIGKSIHSFSIFFLSHKLFTFVSNCLLSSIQHNKISYKYSHSWQVGESNRSAMGTHFSVSFFVLFWSWYMATSTLSCFATTIHFFSHVSSFLAFFLHLSHSSSRMEAQHEYSSLFSRFFPFCGCVLVIYVISDVISIA